MCILVLIDVVDNYLITSEGPWPELHNTRLLIERKVSDIYCTRALKERGKDHEKEHATQLYQYWKPILPILAIINENTSASRSSENIRIRMRERKRSAINWWESWPRSIATRKTFLLQVWASHGAQQKKSNKQTAHSFCYSQKANDDEEHQRMKGPFAARLNQLLC